MDILAIPIPAAHASSGAATSPGRLRLRRGLTRASGTAPHSRRRSRAGGRRRRGARAPPAARRGLLHRR
jgi:hypothetical protein